MKSTHKTEHQLVTENEELRARLDEAEETLRAIRSGEVDALVVSGTGGEHVFTLTGADYVYRVLIENMSEGAVTMSAEGLILYANRHFAGMVRTRLEKVIGSIIHTWIASESRNILQAMLSHSVNEKNGVQLDLVASDGTRVPIYLSVNSLDIGEENNYFCLVLTDLTQQKLSDAIAVSENLTRELLAASDQSRRALLSVIEDQKQAEAEVKHANRSLSILSNVNHTLVHADNEEKILKDICQSIVHGCGFPLTWVGYMQHDAGKSIKIMAFAGHDKGYLDTMQLTWAEEQCGMGPCGRAIRSGTTKLCQDIANDQQFLPWRDEALKHGYASSASLPLLDGAGAVFGAMNVYAGEVKAFTAGEIKLLEEISRDLAFGVCSLRIRRERDLALVENQVQLVQLQESLEDTVRAIATIVEMRDPYTAGHQVRVADLATAIAVQMGLSDEQVHAIHLASTVHDLGKMRVPAEILSKPGIINDIEFSLIKTHAQAGYDILKDIYFPWPIALMVLQHHERMDGSGYPQGLKGDQIILGARIISVADVVEAMSSHRPYRTGLGVNAALAEISAQRGNHFDPQAVDACLAVFRERQYSFKS